MAIRPSPGFVSLLGAAAIVTGGVLLSAVARQDAAPPAPKSAAPEGYVWAGACKDCHKDIYAVWENTKHAKALNRLNTDDQQKDCIGCHVTGAKGLVEEGGKPINAGIQCEACHGPAAAHAADPKARLGKVREDRCTPCHSDKSPHFRGFYYKGMADLSHPIRKT